MDASMMIKVAAVAAALLAAAVGHFYFHLKDDNVIEEVAEEVIEKETGIHIDLTPDSPEYDTPPVK